MDWSYVAGFFDGEGHVSGTSHMEMAQKSPDVLLQIQAFLTEMGIKSQMQYNSASKSWALRISRREEVRKFGENILPLSIVKKSQIQDVLRYFKLYPSLRPFGLSSSTAHEQRCWNILLQTGKLSYRDYELAKA
jgi:LAGLIDADG-like domain